MQSIFPVIFIFSSFYFPSDNCESNFTITTNAANNSYSINLALSNGRLEKYSFELYDVNTGELVIKTEADINTNDPILVFKNIKPSTYTIYFSSVSCSNRKSIKGLGLILE